MDQVPNLMPDFAADEAFPLCKVLMEAFGWNKDRAIQHLENTWRQAHPEHMPARDLPDPPPQECQEEEQPLEHPGRGEDPGDLAGQAQEKKKPTIGNFEEDVPLPNVIACQPSQYALQKIATYDYIELWYFTREGCFEAAKHAHLQADDAFGLLATNEVLTLRAVASVKASKNARADHELMLTEMLQAHTTYLEHMKEVRWPKKHVTVLFKFFWNLECHPFRMST